MVASLRALLWAAVCALATGCAVERAAVKKNLMNDRSGLRNEGVAASYRVACPDVLQIASPVQPELAGRYPVGPDGRIDLGAFGSPRIEGRTPSEIAHVVAERAGLSVEQVKVQVAEYRSRYVHLFGEVVGWQRAVPYRGQETVLDVLQRVGGITPGAEPQDVYVVRTHVADGGRPEVFHVDLHAIVLNKDHRSNIRLLPHDQVYVGETRQARIAECIPPVLRPLFHTLCGTRREAREERIAQRHGPR